MAAPASTKRRKNRHEANIMWFVVKEVLFADSKRSDEEIKKVVYDKFLYHLPAWLLSEARFVYSQKVKKGECPPPGGYTTLEHAKETFMRLCVDDRAKFIDWAQFTFSKLAG